MKSILFTTLLSLTAFTATAADYNRTLFTDDFSGDKFGPRWGHYKSGSIVKDGVLVGITPENSDHSAVENIKFPPEKDLEISVKFRFVSAKAKSFNVWFDDKDYKGSHAGHICSVTISPTSVTMADAKTGNFKKDLYERRKANPNSVTAEEKAMLQTKTTRVNNTVSLQEWHTLVTRTHGDTVEVIIDGKKVGSFKSEGIAHDHKTLVSLTTNPVDVHYDDFSLKAAGAGQASAKQ